MKEKLFKANDHWNYWKFQFHCNNMHWVESNTQDCKKNPLCSLTRKFYIKYGNKPCDFVGQSKLKPIVYDSFFDHKELSSGLKASIGSSKVANKISMLLSYLLKVSKKHLMKCQDKSQQ